MSFISRIREIAGAAGKAGGDLAGFVGDLVTAPFVEDEFEKFWPTVKGVAGKRLLGNQEYGPGYVPHIIGPEGVIGEVIEGLPEGLREGGNELFEVWDDTYREIARLPTTVLTATSLAQSRGDFTGLFDEGTWKDAWQIADPGWDNDEKEYPTLGKALSYLLAGVDILDEDEKVRHEGTTWHKFVSGTTDAVAIIALDPTVLGGKAVLAIRGGGKLGLIASKLGVPGTRATMNVAQKHRQSGVYDRLVAKPYLKFKMGKAKMDEASELVEATVKGQPYKLVLSPRDVMLAGGKKNIQKNLSVGVARRERYFRQDGRFDRLLGSIDNTVDNVSDEAIRAHVVGTKKLPLTPKALNDAKIEIAATKIRQRFFKDNPHGATIARLLTYAQKGHSSFGGARGRAISEDVMRFFLGDNTSIARLSRVNTDVANMLKGIYVAGGTVKQGVVPGMVGARANQSRIINELMPPQLPTHTDELGDMAGMWKTLDDMASPGAFNPLGRLGLDPIRQTYWFTNSVTGKPFRWVMDKRAHSHVLFVDPNSDRMIERMLKQAKVEPDKIQVILTKWNGLDEAGRRRYWEQLIDETIESVLQKHSKKHIFKSKDEWVAAGNKASDYKDHRAMIKDLKDRIFEDYKRSSRHALEDLTKHKVGRALIERLDDGSTSVTQMGTSVPGVSKYADKDTLSLLKTAQTPEHMADVGLIPDFTRFNRSVRRSSMMETDWLWKTTDGIDNLLQRFSNYFKPTVLLNPKWPMRVVGEEQLRMSAVIGGPDALWNLLLNRRNAQEAVLRNLLTDKQILAIAGDMPKKELEKGLRQILFGDTRVVGRRMVLSGTLGYMVAGVPGAVVAPMLSRARNARIVSRMAKPLREKQTIKDMVVAGDKNAANALMEAAGFENLQILGIDVERAFGNPLTPLREWENRVGAQRSVSYMLDQSGSDMKAGNIEFLGDFNDIIKPPSRADLLKKPQKAEVYAQWYERVLNDQFGRSKYSRMFWDDTKTNDDIVAFLESPEGKQTLEDMALVDAETEELLDWVEGVREFTDRLLPPINELADVRRALSNGNRIELRQVIDALGGDEGIKAVKPRHKLSDKAKKERDALSQASVFGPEAQQLRWYDIIGAVHKQEEIVYSGLLNGFMKKTLDKGIQRLGGLYTTQLSRHPLFRAVYEAEMKSKLVNLAIDPGTGLFTISEEALKAMENSSRVTALKAVEDVMYNLAEQSNFAESTRHFFPFFNAWQEVLTRWVGFTMDNPAFVSKVAVTYREAAGLPTYTDPDGKEHWVLHVPEEMREMLSGSPLFGDIMEWWEGELYLNKAGINMITTGLPGAMPTFTFSVSQLARKRPDVGEYVDFMFPYGFVPPRDGSGLFGEMEAFAKSSSPAWGRSLYTAVQGWFKDMGIFIDDLWNDRTYKSMMANITQVWIVEMNEGERELVDFQEPAQYSAFIKDVEHAARSSLMLLTIAKATTPTAIRFASPYQKWIDMARRFYNENPDTADDRFMEELMKEDMEDSFWFLTARSTQSLEGLPPTLPAWETREEFKPYFEKYPELGAIILGLETTGGVKARADFSQFVYQNQKQEETFYGSGEEQRKSLTQLEYILQPDIREGWAKYRMINDKYYAILDDMTGDDGLPVPNMNVTAARAIKNLRDDEVKLLQEENPVWAEDFEEKNFDKGKFFEGLRKLVDDPVMVGRVDIQLIGEYLDLRDGFTEMLKNNHVRGKSIQIDASDNTVIKGLWDENIANMVASNPAFRDIWLRWFEFDMMEPETWTPAQRKVYE